MDAVDTGHQPMAHPLDVTQRLRDDEVTETDRRQHYETAPAVDNGLYLVPKVIGDPRRDPPSLNQDSPPTP